MSCLSSDLTDFISCVSSGLAVNCLKATIEKIPPFFFWKETTNTPS